MKKLVILMLSLIISYNLSAKALTYEDAINQQKPVALLIYADWADDAQKVFQAFTTKSQQYGDRYNFVPMNIASEQTKAFNKTYHIYPGLPYVLLFKDRGRISRYLKKDCILDNACFNERLDLFNN